MAERSSEGGDAGGTGGELEMAGASPSTDGGSGTFAIAVDPQRREHALRHVMRDDSRTCSYYFTARHNPAVLNSSSTCPCAHTGYQTRPGAPVVLDTYNPLPLIRGQRLKTCVWLRY